MSEPERKNLTIDAFAALRGLTRRQVTYRIDRLGFPFVDAPGEARTGPGNSRRIDPVAWIEHERQQEAQRAPGKLQLMRLRRDITTDNWRAADKALAALLIGREYVGASREIQRQQYRTIKRARDVVRAAMAREAGCDGLHSDIR